MEENKQIKNMLKITIIIICLIIIIIAGITIIIRYFIKSDLRYPNKSDNNAYITEEIKDETNIIYSEKIKTIIIEYYEGYNIGSGEISNNVIPLNQIELHDNNLKEISELINNLTENNPSKYEEEYGIVYMCDNYRLKINDNFILYIGEEYGMVSETGECFKVPKALYSKIEEIAKNYSEKNLYKKIDSKKISIICNEESFEVTDEEQLSKLSNYQYYIINSSDDDFKSKEIVYTLDLGDGRTIDIYRASVLNCIYYKNGAHYYIYTGDLVDYVEKIFNNSKVKINTDPVDSIIVAYKDQKYIIDNQNKIEELLKKFKNLAYNDYKYLESISEEDFDQNDIKIYVNKSKYIIPGDKSWGSRFYIDEDGKIYDVSGLYNNNLETYFKELVNYEE